MLLGCAPECYKFQRFVTVQATLEEDSLKETVAIAPLYSLIAMVPVDIQLIDFTDVA